MHQVSGRMAKTMQENDKTCEVGAVVDSECCDIADDYSVRAILKTLHQDCIRDGNTLAAESARWEMVALAFALVEGAAKAEVGYEDGSEYPTEDDLGEDGIEYVKSRADRTTNPVLKARYAHLVWCFKKNHLYARQAVDAYLGLIKQYEAKDLQDPEGHHGHAVLHCIQNAFALSLAVGHRKGDIVEEILRIVQNYSYESKSVFLIKVKLLELIIDNRKLFGDENLRRIGGWVSDITGEMRKQGYPLGFISDFLRVAIDACNKLQQDASKWWKNVGEIKMEQMRERQEGDLARQGYCIDAIEAYRKAGEKQKVDELERQLPSTVENVQFHRSAIQVDMTEIVNQYGAIIEQVSTKTPREIVEFLVFYEMLPTMDEVTTLVSKTPRSDVAELFSIQQIDGYGNVAGDEKDAFAFRRAYEVSLQVNYVFVERLLTRLIGDDKLNAEQLLEILGKHSWFGKTVIRNVAGNKAEFRCLDLIRPGINEYFAQMHVAIASKEKSNFMLATDSLVVKIEGILRCLCQIKGGSITRVKSGGQETQLRMLDDLLESDVIKSTLKPDTHYFLKYLVGDRLCMNLRNKVAHGSALPSEYSMANANLILLAILRLVPY